MKYVSLCFQFPHHVLSGIMVPYACAHFLMKCRNAATVKAPSKVGNPGIFKGLQWGTQPVNPGHGMAII